MEIFFWKIDTGFLVIKWARMGVKTSRNLE